MKSLLVSRLTLQKMFTLYFYFEYKPIIIIIMLISRLLKSPILKRTIPVSHGNFLLLNSFAKIKQILKHTDNLKDIDSLKLQKMCEDVLKNYDLRKNRGHTKQTKTDQKTSEEAEQTELTPQMSIIQLYRILSQAKLGFLKGDMHSELIFKLNKLIQEKIDKEKNSLHGRKLNGGRQMNKIIKRVHESQISNQEYKTLLENITENKYFRIPKKGILNHYKEDKINLYQRQLILEIVSNEQSYSRFQNILDSLKKLGKTHLSECLRKYMVEWLSPICQAIRQQQQKCKLVLQGSQIQGDRKIYAEYFLKLTPEKLANVCISELMKEITTKLFKSIEEDSGFELYAGIKYQSLCMNLAKWVCLQTAYEKEEARFKGVMKEYDSLFREQKKRRQQSQSKAVENKVLEDDDPTKINEEERIKLQIEKQAADILQEKKSNQNSDKFLTPEMKAQQVFKYKVYEIKRNTGFGFVKPEDRKNYLVQISNKLIRSYSKIRHEMPEEVQFHIGSMLIYLMKEIIKIKNKSGYRIPLLSLEHKLLKKDQDVVSIKILRINEHFFNTIEPIIEKQGDLFLHLDRSLPTMIKPLQWVDYEIGGYYMKPTSVMRISECKLQEDLIKYGDISRVYGVLNYLGGIGWKINKKVLNIVQKIWEEGGGVGEIPKRYSEMVETYISLYKKEKNPLKLKFYARKIQELRDEHSLRSDFNLKLNIARSFGTLDRFYYPHNLDFRGRVYPVPPHLNHIGNDLSRGLLTFADGRKLGKSGLKWLKIHCANLMGKDKATLPEKLEYTQSNLDLIQAIAEDPLKNREWLSYEDCWQALASIFQLHQALKSPNPEEFVSNLHVHQDGSCNGLQHYAALGRDMQGAYQVNLGPTERPGDVYTHVAKMVIKMIDQDIANPESPHHDLAKKLNENIKRKTIKQTVMTSVYGVTFIGARQQIHRQIKDQKFLEFEEQEYKASIYLAKLTLQAISNLFSRAHLIKKWLISCAKIVSDYGNPVGWITPMGLPVVQPYRSISQSDEVSTIIQKLRLPSQSDNLPVNKSKQKSAFPPNFVHSLDSTHMMYTSERCKKLGLTFAAVHDSYWTHAGTVQNMNELLREQFIRLHSEPLLQNLKSSLERRYIGVEFPPIPDRGEFDLQKIKQSLYFFS